MSFCCVFRISSKRIYTVIILGMVPGDSLPRKFGIPPEILTIGFWFCEIPVM